MFEGKLKYFVPCMHEKLGHHSL